MNQNELFTDWVLEATPTSVEDCQYPLVYTDNEGDRVEFFLSGEDWVSDRIDGRLTVYRDRETNEIVGGSIKGIALLVKRLLSEFPGFALNIHEGQVALTFLFSAAQPRESDEVLSMHYREVFNKLRLSHRTVRLPAPSLLET